MHVKFARAIADTLQVIRSLRAAGVEPVTDVGVILAGLGSCLQGSASHGLYCHCAAPSVPALVSSDLGPISCS